MLLVTAAVPAWAEKAPIQPPGPPLAVPDYPSTPDAPRIYAYTREAGPDQTFFVTGGNLAPDVIAWGSSDASEAGQEWKPKVQFCDGRYMAVTLPQQSYDGVFVVRVRGEKGYSRPFVLNAPEIWWATPDVAHPGSQVDLFGVNLARRPDFDRAFVYVREERSGKGRWLAVRQCGKYRLRVLLPQGLSEGVYTLWCHTGAGGDYGWSAPVRLKVRAKTASPKRVALKEMSEKGLRAAIEAAEKAGGGMISLPAGVVEFSGTLKLGRGVVLAGAGDGVTVLRCSSRRSSQYACVGVSGWNQAPGGVHTPGDIMEYVLDVPQSGKWTVWLRYATEMSPWGQPGVSGNMELAVDGGKPVPLESLPNTGSFGAFKWSQSATLRLTKGRHRLIWRNAKGGGISLDAFVFALSPDFVPSDAPFPESSSEVIVLQGEETIRFQTKEGSLPGQERVALWLAGDASGLRDLSVQGSPVINTGVLIRHEKFPRWIEDCQIEKVRITGVEGKQGENRAIHLCYARRAKVLKCELWGRSPIYLSGVHQCVVSDNRLTCQTRFGGNAEAAIQGRNNIVEECVIEHNVIASPDGIEAGGPTVRRMIWVSTGHGSITRNWFGFNSADRARFAGVAGTDQNVGEMILFEACQRIAFFGPIESSGKDSVTLPETLPSTPESRLGDVRRSTLAYDPQGRETPFWPPGQDDGAGEPPIDQYYVTVLDGSGIGQTRRVTHRTGRTLFLDRPWREPPEAGARVVICTLYYQNLVAKNDVPDGMTGIQLWIGCVENVISGNTIHRQRRPGLFLYGTCTTLASSMPQTWNRGIGPLSFNVCEGNLTEECSDGALVTSGDDPSIPIEFPRALGNVLRYNSFIRNRANGVNITSRRKGQGDTSASVVGTIVEFNMVRDAGIGYHVGEEADHMVLRRNHSYFWYPVLISSDPPVGFQLDRPGTYALEENNVEDRFGGEAPAGGIVKERHLYKE